MLSQRPSSAIDTRRLRSFDGTEIAYYLADSSAPDAPWVVIANGLSGNAAIWRGPVEYLRDRYRFLTWDPRGLYESERPRPDRAEAYRVECHVRDLEGLLAKERIERASFIGFSSGVQVVLEAYARLGRRAQSLVLVNGAAGRPLDGLAKLSLARGAILPAIELFRRAHVLSPVHKRAMGKREAAMWLRRLGLVRGTLDESLHASLERAMAKLDVDALLRNIRAFGEHDARAALPSVTVPTLVVAGDRDPLTPREVAQQMARAIPEAELFVVRGGSHYTIAEYPELVALRIERFLREHESR
jgi:pimeloyl-ACP methyl ester carboxylesterase